MYVCIVHMALQTGSMSKSTAQGHNTLLTLNLPFSGHCDKNRYQELKAEVQKKLRVDKQQQLEDMCAELEAANTKGNSRQVFQIVKSMTRKFQPRLQCIQCYELYACVQKTGSV